MEGLRWPTCSPDPGPSGIEALSRGAASVTFVDRDPAALAAVRANLASVGLPTPRGTATPPWSGPTWTRWVATTASRYDLALV